MAKEEEYKEMFLAEAEESYEELIVCLRNWKKITKADLLLTPFLE